MKQALACLACRTTLEKEVAASFAKAPQSTSPSGRDASAVAAGVKVGVHSTQRVFLSAPLFGSRHAVSSHLDQCGV